MMDPYMLPDALNQFALIPRIDEKIANLASLAESEDWEYHQTSADRSNPILFNYFRHTYARIAIEKRWP